MAPSQIFFWKYILICHHIFSLKLELFQWTLNNWEFSVYFIVNYHYKICLLYGKASVYNAGDLGSIPRLGRFPGEGNGNPLQYSYLENPTDGGAWCRLLSMGLQRVGLNWATSHHFTEIVTDLDSITYEAVGRHTIRHRHSHRYRHPTPVFP